MERRGDRQQHRAPGALGLGDLDRALDRRLVAGHHDLPAAIVVGGLADLALRGLGRDRRRRVELQCRAAPPSRRCRPAPPAAWRGRGCAAAARCRRCVNAPAAASAEYSPSEWPATNCASRLRSTPASASSTRIAASETAISAGWAFSVSVSLSAGPSHMIAVSFSPSASSTSSNTARAGERPRPAPCPCRPPGCPGPGIRRLPSSACNPLAKSGRMAPISRRVSSQRASSRPPGTQSGPKACVLPENPYKPPHSVDRPGAERTAACPRQRR